MERDYTELIERCKAIVEFDVARISHPMGTMYLIIGFWKNTKEDKSSQWLKNGEPINFDYVEEKIIASGKTDEELIASVEEYKRLSKMSWEEYFKTVAEGKERNILNLYPTGPTIPVSEKPLSEGA